MLISAEYPTSDMFWTLLLIRIRLKKEKDTETVLNYCRTTNRARIEEVRVIPSGAKLRVKIIGIRLDPDPRSDLHFHKYSTLLLLLFQFLNYSVRVKYAKFKKKIRKCQF